MKSQLKSVSFLAILFLAVAPGWAQVGSWTVSTGWSHLHVDHVSDGLFYGKDGAYLDGDVNWLVAREPVPLLLGAGLSVAGFYDSRDVTFSGNPYYFSTWLVSDVSLVAFEGRASIPISPREWGGWFVMPRIATGLLVDSYAIDKPTWTEYHTGAAFEIRPSVQAGYSWGKGSVGAECSYMAAWGDFGHLGSSALEFRAGVFLRFRF